MTLEWKNVYLSKDNLNNNFFTVESVIVGDRKLRNNAPDCHAQFIAKDVFRDVMQLALVATSQW